MESSGKSLKQVKVEVIEGTDESFKDYGQVIGPSPDGEEFGPHDAQLELSRGTPRFYIMNLTGRSLKFGSITHHASVTQCLGSIGGHTWYLGVAKSSILEPNQEKSDKGPNAVQARAGHFYVPPAIEDVRVFRFSGPKFVKLNVGTWHAGPLFKPQEMAFYNLELSNTNVVDHTTHYFKTDDNVMFTFDE